MTTRANPRTGYKLAAIVVLATAAAWLPTLALNEDLVGVPSHWVGVPLAAIFLAAIVIQFFWFLTVLIRDPTRSDIATIVYVLANLAAIIVLFAVLYRWFGLKDGDNTAPEMLTCIYFSIVTWTTLGYGDVTPIGYSRTVAAVEVLVGFLAMGFLVSITLAILKPR